MAGLGCSLNFDTFLNCLDGVERSEGVFTILTTNHLNLVDEALLNRPGRIDKVIEMGCLTLINKMKMANHILSDIPAAKKIMIDYINLNPDEHLTPAQLQEKCTSLALTYLYDRK